MWMTHRKFPLPYSQAFSSRDDSLTPIWLSLAPAVWQYAASNTAMTSSLYCFCLNHSKIVKSAWGVTCSLQQNWNQDYYQNFQELGSILRTESPILINMKGLSSFLRFRNDTKISSTFLRTKGAHHWIYFEQTNTPLYVLKSDTT